MSDLVDRNDLLEELWRGIRQMQEIYLSPEYSANQPISSFKERFACGQILRLLEKMATRKIGDLDDE